MADETQYYLYSGEKRLIVEMPQVLGQVGSVLLPDQNSIEAYCWARIIANFEENDVACAPYEEYAYVKRDDGIPMEYLGKKLFSVQLDRVYAISTTTPAE